jgi:exopolysaccharide production protein ExoY
MTAQASSLHRLRLGSPSHSIERKLKFLMDIIIGSLALLILTPLLLIISLLIKGSDRGPIFYKHTRVGVKGRTFNCLKFRSMAVNADEMLSEYLESNPQARSEWAVHRKLTSDPRVTRLGLFLRTTSLDELPQLFNVMCGKMSLVGPRPVTEEELSRYGDYVALYISVRPGITGLWQVSGRSDCIYAERVQLDARYVSEWRLHKDVLILLKTIPVVLKRQGSR